MNHADRIRAVFQWFFVGIAVVTVLFVLLVMNVYLASKAHQWLHEHHMPAEEE